MTFDGIALRIRNFDATYEYNKSRTIAGPLKFILAPTSFETAKGYRYLTREGVEGLAWWGLYQALVLLAARVPRPSRGCLVDEDGPVSAETLALQLGYDEAIIEQGLAVLAGPKVGLLERVEWRGEQLEVVRPDGVAEAPGGCPDGDREVSAARPAGPGPRPPSAPGKGKERQGTERQGNGTAGHGTGPVRRRKGMESVGHDGRAPDDRPVVTPAVAPRAIGMAPEGNGTERQGPAPGEERAGEELSADGGRGRRDGPREVFCQRFLLEVCQAAGLDNARANGQRNAIMAVADRLADRVDRDTVKMELVQLATAKARATPRLQRPMAAWQAEVDRRYPPNGKGDDHA